MAESVIEAANDQLSTNDERLEAIQSTLQMLDGPIPDLWSALARGDRLLAAGAAFHASSSVRRQAAVAGGLPLRAVARLVRDPDVGVMHAWAGNPDPCFEPYRERLLDEPSCAGTAWRQLGMPTEHIDRMLAAVDDEDLSSLLRVGLAVPPRVFAEGFVRCREVEVRMQLVATLDADPAYQSRVWSEVFRRADEATAAFALVRLGRLSEEFEEAQDSKHPVLSAVARAMELRTPSQADADPYSWIGRLKELLLTDSAVPEHASDVASVDPVDRFMACGRSDLDPALRALLICDPRPVVQVAASLPGQTHWAECLECGTSWHRGDGGYDCLIRYSTWLLENGIVIAASDPSVPAAMRRAWPEGFRDERTVGVRINSSKYGKYSRQTAKVLTSFVTGVPAREVANALVLGGNKKATVAGYQALIERCLDYMDASTSLEADAFDDFVRSIQ